MEELLYWTELHYTYVLNEVASDCTCISSWSYNQHIQVQYITLACEHTLKSKTDKTNIHYIILNEHNTAIIL